MVSCQVFGPFQISAYGGIESFLELAWHLRVENLSLVTILETSLELIPGFLFELDALPCLNISSFNVRLAAVRRLSVNH